MLRHVVLFAWVPEATDEQKQQVIDELRTLVIDPISRERVAVQYEV
jgi:hypothetical protein